MAMKMKTFTVVITWAFDADENPEDADVKDEARSREQIEEMVRDGGYDIKSVEVGDITQVTRADCSPGFCDLCSAEANHAVYHGDA